MGVKNKSKKNLRDTSKRMKVESIPLHVLEDFDREDSLDSSKPDLTINQLDKNKLALFAEIIKTASDEIKAIFKECDVVGLNERVTYHKMKKNENMPYTHIFENEAVLLKMRNHPILIIYGPKIEYKNGFIEN